MLLCISGELVFAHEDHKDLVEEMVVYGRSLEQLGRASAASSGQVGDADIQLASRLRVGELVESVPGMVATQHSGTGKANQYFLRGFNLDHGTDFSAHAEGVPLNLRTHGHGQGYLDLNFLIPEMVSTTQFRKGPYHASVGDFSSAGSVEFLFYDQLSEPVITTTFGDDAYRRGLIAGSADSGAGVLTGALDITRYDGPWQQPESLEQYKIQLRYAAPLGKSRAYFDFQGYQGDWDATDQIPMRAVRSGSVGELGFIDPDLGGRTDRYAFNASFEFPNWSLNAYLLDYDFALYSNFTYFLNDPVSGDEFEQRDKRRMYGVNIGGRLDRLSDRPISLLWGLQSRLDNIDELGLYLTQARVRQEAIRTDSVDEFSVGAFAEIEANFTDKLRGILGVRGDYYHWDVGARQQVNAGSGSDLLYSPKVSFAYRVNDSLEAYANWGRGFHSNDVRGATVSVDPATGELLDPLDVLVATQGAEFGIRLERGEMFNAALVGFWLAVDSELVFVGDAGGTEATNGSKRHGVEANLFWQATDWLALDANYTYTDASFDRAPGGEDAIPGAIGSTGSMGLSAVWSNGITSFVRVRYLGPAPLVEDESVETQSSVLVNAGVGYRFGSFELRVDLFNAFDSNDHDVSYLYRSRLPGESADGVEDVHFHPLEPRSVRATLIWRPAPAK